MRFNTNFKTREKRSFRISSFRGVDLTSSEKKIAAGRAARMINFKAENGSLVKRSGYRDFCAAFQGPVNGLFSYENGSEKCIIAHVGTNIYKLTVNGDTSSRTLISSGISGLTNTRSQAFMRNGRLFIIGCGDYLVYGFYNGAYSLRRVTDCEDVHIPLTTININDTSVTSDVRGTLEGVNMLTPWRKNGLVGSSESGVHEWQLDAAPDAGTQVYVEIEYEVSVPDVGIYRIETKELSVDLNRQNADGSYPLIDTAEAEYGAIYYTVGILRLNSSWSPPTEGRDNITVTFRHTTAGYADRIKNSTFGTLFGVDGNNDRLFLSGNPLYRNMEWWSEAEDFTYFPDQYACAIGSDGSAINGYVRLDDETLGVLKEGGSGEATVYYQSGNWRQKSDGEGNLQEMRAVFPVRAGSIGKSSVNRFAAGNLAGDPLILCRDGVYGIRLMSNLSTDNRYAAERSGMIRSALEGAVLTNGAAVVYDGKYYLSLADAEGTVYVADAALTCYPDDSAEKHRQYEWFVYKNIPARVWIEYDGKLLFGTSTGHVCIFDGGQTDRSGFGLGETALPIDAEWTSGALDLGDFSVTKTLCSLSVSAEKTKGTVTFGFRTRNRGAEYGMKGLRIFSFNDFSFKDLSFENGYANAYTVKVKEHDFNYITFRITASGAHRCRIEDLCAVFKYKSGIKGVR